MKEQLKKRVKSFSWRIGSMTSVYLLSTLISELRTEEFSPELSPYINLFIVLLGLILGEVTKLLNNLKHRWISSDEN